MKNKILIAIGFVATTALVSCTNPKNSEESVTYNCPDTPTVFTNASNAIMSATVTGVGTANCKMKFTCNSGYYILPAAKTLAVGSGIYTATYTGDAGIILYNSVRLVLNEVNWLDTNGGFYGNAEGNTYATCIPNQ